MDYVECMRMKFITIELIHHFFTGYLYNLMKAPTIGIKKMQDSLKYHIKLFSLPALTHFSVNFMHICGCGT